jgi:hypothetical protein
LRCPSAARFSQIGSRAARTVLKYIVSIGRDTTAQVSKNDILVGATQPLASVNCGDYQFTDCGAESIYADLRREVAICGIPRHACGAAPACAAVAQRQRPPTFGDRGARCDREHAFGVNPVTHANYVVNGSCQAAVSRARGASGEKLRMFDRLRPDLNMKTESRGRRDRQRSLQTDLEIANPQNMQWERCAASRDRHRRRSAIIANCCARRRQALPAGGARLGRHRTRG